MYSTSIKISEVHVTVRAQTCSCCLYEHVRMPTCMPPLLEYQTTHDTWESETLIWKIEIY
jgi:hypothetical protein